MKNWYLAVFAILVAVTALPLIATQGNGSDKGTRGTARYLLITPDVELDADVRRATKIGKPAKANYTPVTGTNKCGSKWDSGTSTWVEDTLFNNKAMKEVVVITTAQGKKGVLPGHAFLRMDGAEQMLDNGDQCTTFDLKEDGHPDGNKCYTSDFDGDSYDDYMYKYQADCVK